MQQLIPIKCIRDKNLSKSDNMIKSVLLLTTYGAARSLEKHGMSLKPNHHVKLSLSKIDIFWAFEIIILSFVAFTF